MDRTPASAARHLCCAGGWWRNPVAVNGKDPMIYGVLSMFHSVSEGYSVKKIWDCNDSKLEQVEYASNV